MVARGIYKKQNPKQGIRPPRRYLRPNFMCVSYPYHNTRKREEELYRSSSHYNNPASGAARPNALIPVPVIRRKQIIRVYSQKKSNANIRIKIKLLNHACSPKPHQRLFKQTNQQVSSARDQCSGKKVQERSRGPRLDQTSRVSRCRSFRWDVISRAAQIETWGWPCQRRDSWIPDSLSPHSHAPRWRSTISPARSSALIPSSPFLLFPLGVGAVDNEGDVMTTSPPFDCSIFMC